MPAHFVILAHTPLFAEECERRFRCKECVNLVAGESFFLAVPNAGDGAAQDFLGGVVQGVRGHQATAFFFGLARAGYAIGRIPLAPMIRRTVANSGLPFSPSVL
jgi:hypothetical protein